MKANHKPGNRTRHCHRVLLVVLVAGGIAAQAFLLGYAMAAHGHAGWLASISCMQQQQQQGSDVPALQGPAHGVASIRPFVGVLSSPSNFQAREMIRATWGSDKRVARLMFFTLRPQSNTQFRDLRREAAQAGDVVVVAEVLSHHHNITYSTYEIFKTAARIGGFTHVLKTDDDCYVRWNNLLPALADMPTEWLYAGWPMRFGEVHRDGRYAVPLRNWSHRKTARYAYGWGYVVSMDIAKEIAAGAPLMVMEPGNMLVLEDVAVGYWILAISLDRHVGINYKLLASRQNCSESSQVVHLKPTTGTPWDMMQCMFQSGGQCCNCTQTGCLAAGTV